MLGRIAHLLRTRYAHGFRTAWQRDIVRPRILKTPPIECSRSSSCEIHALTCDRDWIDLVWALKSLFHVTDLRFRVCIHEDGTLTDTALNELQTHFPGARCIRRSDADNHMSSVLRGHPASASYRNTNPLALKVFDFSAFLEAEKMLLLDCDILFFSPPHALLNRISDNTYSLNSLNRDWRYGYSIDIAECEGLLDFCIQSHINSGLGLVHRRSYSLARFEEWLSLPGIRSHHHRVEQTLVALACSSYGHEFLPEEYNVTTRSAGENIPAKHYTGPIRHLLYREGIYNLRALLREPT